MAGNLPTKKQRELLSFIDGFIKGNGYAPSFREIQRSLAYKSVSTVAIHVDGLIAKGYLRKVDNSARTLEVCTPVATKNPHVEWLESERDKYDKESGEFALLKSAIEVILKSA